MDTRARKGLDMRGKLMFITGVGVGYVLGTRAGRQKFDQMMAQAKRVWESPTVQEAAGVVQEQANRLYDQGKQAVSDQVHKLGKNGKGPDSDNDAWGETSAQQSPATAF
jgi:hypothetical protein